MKRDELTTSIAAMLAAGVVAACKKPPAQAESGELQRGERVVVEVSEAHFIEGRVLASLDGKIRVQSVNDGDQILADRGDVSRTSDVLPVTSSEQYAICEWAPHQWCGCQIQSTRGGGLEALNLMGEHKILPRDQVLRVNAATAQSQTRMFAAAKARGRFEAAARAAGRPLRPGGWRPALGDSVVAERGEKWVTARVTKEMDGGVQVAWSGSDAVTVLRPNQVIPTVPVPAPSPPAAGSFVLVRGAAVPEHESDEWVRARVEAANDAEVIISDRDGKRHRVALRDIVLLSR